MTDTYPIVSKLPKGREPFPLDIPKLKASLLALEKVGAGFVIPAAELVNNKGVFYSTPIGQRVYRLAKSLGITVTTKKLAEGLRVRREA